MKTTDKQKKTSTAFGFTATLTHDKETKGTHRYADDSDDAPVPTLYIKKTAFGKTVPDAITIVVTGKLKKSTGDDED